jgi:hypothetical protein
MLLTGLFYIIVPILLIGLLAFKRQSSILLWIFTVLSFGSVIAYLWGVARWDIVSIYFRPIFPILFLIASFIGFKRIKKPKTPQKKIFLISTIVFNLVIIIFMSGLNWFSFKGYATPKNAINLTSPFRNGKQIILHGGSSPFTNGHFHVKPQNYALDIVGLNNLGMRASSIAGGSDLDNYEIYGELIFSPCDGVVVVVVDEYNDQNPPKTDIKHIAGNHILIKSGDNEILLAHLKKGSIKVKAGDIVTTNTLLGQVGNTGNTSEPHLHLHVENGGKPETILNGKAIPFTINEQFLVRGDILEFKN